MLSLLKFILTSLFKKWKILNKNETIISGIGDGLFFEISMNEKLEK